MSANRQAHPVSRASANDALSSACAARAGVGHEARGCERLEMSLVACWGQGCSRADCHDRAAKARTAVSRTDMPVMMGRWNYPGDGGPNQVVPSSSPHFLGHALTNDPRLSSKRLEDRIDDEA